MHAVALICGFLGSWLLVAGPIYQAALELHGQDIAEGRIHEVARSIEAPAEVSDWWWLLPPIRVYLARRRLNEYRRRYFAALSVEDSKALLVYANKATAWLLVGLGGLLVATASTCSVAEHFGWGPLPTVAIVVALLAASIGYNTGRVRRHDALIQRKAGASDG